MKFENDVSRAKWIFTQTIKQEITIIKCPHLANARAFLKSFKRLVFFMVQLHRFKYQLLYWNVFNYIIFQYYIEKTFYDIFLMIFAIFFLFIFIRIVSFDCCYIVATFRVR